jgi:VCBS repeat-containing protein
MLRRQARLSSILIVALAIAVPEARGQSGSPAESSLRGTVPVVGSTAGAFGSQFRTELQINNPSGEPASGWIVLRPAGSAAPDVARRYDLAPRETHAIADVVAELGHEGLGSLDIAVESGATPVVVARAFDDAAEGTKGVMLPLLGPEEATGRGETTALIIPGDLEQFRFNIGARALGDGAILEMIVFDAGGGIAHRTGRMSMAAHRFEQRAARQWLGIETLPVGGLVLVRVYSGSIFVYGTTTDNRTNDPSMQIESNMVEPPALVGGGDLIQVTVGVGERRTLQIVFAGAGRLSSTIVSGPFHGVVHQMRESPSGVVEIDYEPTAGYEGEDEIVVLVEDAAGGFAEITVRINVTDAPNRPPVAHPQTVTTARDTAVAIVLTGSDPDGDALTFTVTANPVHGVLSGTAPNLIYTPGAGFTGTDAFAFIVSDGTATSPAATVTIDVTAAPLELRLSAATIEENRFPGTFIGTFSTIDSEGSGPHHYTLVFGDGDSHNALFRIEGDRLVSAAVFDFESQPAPSLRVRTTNSEGLWLEESFMITVLDVNDRPVAADDFYTVVRGGTLTIGRFAGVLSNDTDQDSPVLVAHLESAPRFGTLTLSGNGAFTYVHDGSNSSRDSFTYRANDEFVGSEPATVQIAITTSNTAPVARDDDYSVLRGGVLMVPAATGVLANDTDAEGALLEAILVSGPARGRLTFRGDGSFTYEHDGSSQLAQSFTYRTTDGQKESNISTVVITRVSLNEQPVAVADRYSIVRGGRIDLSAPGVLENDSDADNDPLAAVLVSRPSHGALTLHPDGSFTYIHDGAHPPTDHFSYRAHDGQQGSEVAVVTIDIRETNTAPQASGEMYATLQNVMLREEAPGILANDSDVDGDALTVVLMHGVLNGTLALGADGSFVYVPALDFVGRDSFSYIVTDGALTSNRVTTTIDVFPGP